MNGVSLFVNEYNNLVWYFMFIFLLLNGREKVNFR